MERSSVNVAFNGVALPIFTWIHWLMAMEMNCCGCEIDDCSACEWKALYVNRTSWHWATSDLVIYKWIPVKMGNERTLIRMQDLAVVRLALSILPDKSTRQQVWVGNAFLSLVATRQSCHHLYWSVGHVRVCACQTEQSMPNNIIDTLRLKNRRNIRRYYTLENSILNFIYSYFARALVHCICSSVMQTTHFGRRNVHQMPRDMQQVEFSSHRLLTHQKCKNFLFPSRGTHERNKFVFWHSAEHQFIRLMATSWTFNWIKSFELPSSKYEYAAMDAFIFPMSTESTENIIISCLRSGMTHNKRSIIIV